MILWRTKMNVITKSLGPFLSLFLLFGQSLAFSKSPFIEKKFSDMVIDKPLEGQFSHSLPFLGLSSGLSMPFIKNKKNRNYYYETTLGLSFRTPLVGHFDFDVDAVYGKIRWERWSQEVKRTDFFKSDIYLGYAFPKIKPGWRFVLRGGLYYNTFQFYNLDHKRDIIKAPQISPLWLYEQKDGSLFHMSFKYIHLDRGPLFTKGAGKMESGLGFKVGEVIPLNKDVGLLYNVEFESFVLADDQKQTHLIRNVIFSIGIGS
jgi:hypothetical protein